jgi:hypothetical protein
VDGRDVDVVFSASTLRHAALLGLFPGHAAGRGRGRAVAGRVVRVRVGVRLRVVS